MLYLSQGPHLRHHLVLPMCEPCSQCFLAFHCVLTSFSLISNPPWDIWNHQGVLPLVDFPRLAYRVMTNIFTHSQLQPFSVSLPNIDGLSTWPLSWRTGTKLLRQRNSGKTEAVPVIEEKKPALSSSPVRSAKQKASHCVTSWGPGSLLYYTYKTPIL